MTVWAWSAVGTAAALLMAALGDLISEEIQGWLDLAPQSILRLAASQLDPAQREPIYQGEWLPELSYALRGAESRPITRLIRGTSYAIGLLISARRITRTLPPRTASGAEQQHFRLWLAYQGVEADISRVLPRVAADQGITESEILTTPELVDRIRNVGAHMIWPDAPLDQVELRTQRPRGQLASEGLIGCGWSVIPEDERPQG